MFLTSKDLLYNGSFFSFAIFSHLKRSIKGFISSGVWLIEELLEIQGLNVRRQMIKILPRCKDNGAIGCYVQSLITAFWYLDNLVMTWLAIKPKVFMKSDRCSLYIYSKKFSHFLSVFSFFSFEGGKERYWCDQVFFYLVPVTLLTESLFREIRQLESKPLQIWKLKNKINKTNLTKYEWKMWTLR